MALEQERPPVILEHFKGILTLAVPIFGLVAILDIPFYFTWYFLVPIGLLISSIFILSLRPEVAALVSIIGLLFMVIFHRERRGALKIHHLMKLIQGSSKFMLEIIVVCAAAGFIVGLVTYTGLGQSLSLFLTELIGSMSLKSLPFPRVESMFGNQPSAFV